MFNVYKGNNEINLNYNNCSDLVRSASTPSYKRVCFCAYNEYARLSKENNGMWFDRGYDTITVKLTNTFLF